jgi:hypothetical protein
MENEQVGVWKDRNTFDAFKKSESISFDRVDGGLRIAIDGYMTEIFRMNAEQFAAFKEWVKEV